ncbi:MAG: helix-turn-helix domain-containing protein [Raoultibacter sp.]
MKVIDVLLCKEGSFSRLDAKSVMLNRNGDAMPHIAIDSLFADEQNLSLEVKTKLKILRSIDCSLKTVSVREICKKCGVSRATFYYHFKSKNEIPLWYSKLIQKFTLSEVGRTLSWEEGLRVHFGLLYKEREFYVSTIDMVGQDFSKANMRSHRRDCLVETLTHFCNIPLTEEFEFYIGAYIDMEIERAQRWFASGMMIDSDTFARYLCNSVPRPLYEAFSITSKPSF